MPMAKDKLVLGAAGKTHADAMTLDIDKRHNPDVVWDLNRTPWPFTDSQFRHITCHHVLEHLQELDSILKELHRICSPEGTIYIEVPHFSSWMANDPPHKLRFSYFSLNAYLADGKSWILSEVKFRLLERRVTFHRAFRRYGLHRLWNRFPMAYERFWTYIMPAEHLIYRLQPIKKTA